MADINPYAGGSIPSNIYTKKEEGYANTIKGQNTNKNNPAKVQRMTDAKGNTTGYLLRDKKGNVLERQDAQGKVIKDDYNKVSDITGMETDKAASKTQDVVDTAGNKKGKLRLTSDGTVYKAEDAAGDTIKSNYSTMNAVTGMPDEENAPVNYLDANKPAPAGSSAYKGGSGVASGSTDGSSSAGTDEAALSNGISTDEPTEDLSAPWKDTDEAVESIKKDINAEAAATPEMKSIWSAWKNGDIDKATRNYFIADALAKFAGDMGNISHAQHANNMWANIEKGEQKNPMENVKGENQWQDYLKTDWKEAQKLKNEARSKDLLGNIDIQLDISKQRGFDQYLANEKPEILKDSKWAKMAKEDPDSYAVLMQLGQMMDGKSPLTADQLGNLTDAAGNAKLGNNVGQKQYEMLGISKQQAEESLQALKFANELNKATKQYQIDAQKYGVDSIQAQNAAMWAQTAGQNLVNAFSKETLPARVKQTIYKGVQVNAGPVSMDSGGLASTFSALGNYLR